MTRFTVEINCSKVNLESAPGKGSKFELTLQIKTQSSHLDSPENFELGLTHRASTDISSLQGRRILLAEDMPDNQKLVSLYLKSAGALVEIAENGEEAYEMAISQSYDLVLMDVQMPVMGGLEATQRLRAQGYQKPILALTAHAMKEEKDLSLQAGCNGHLTKPISKKILIDEVHRYLTIPSR